MISVIITSENISGNRITVNEKSDINHLKNVFRIKIDEGIRAVDGEKEYYCKVVSIDKKEIVLEILKNDKMDLTIQKLTEIGINKIIPLAVKRGVAKITEKKDKWDLIVKEALKQCQAVKATEIDEVKKLEEIEFEKYDLVIVPYECEEEYTLKNLLRNREKLPERVLYIIGSEGGFDPEEIIFLKNKKADIVTLGRRILRAETASIVVGGILINEFQ